MRIISWLITIIFAVSVINHYRCSLIRNKIQVTGPGKNYHGHNIRSRHLNQTPYLRQNNLVSTYLRPSFDIQYSKYINRNPVTSTIYGINPVKPELPYHTIIPDDIIPSYDTVPYTVSLNRLCTILMDRFCRSNLVTVNGTCHNECINYHRWIVLLFSSFSCLTPFGEFQRPADRGDLWGGEYGQAPD